MLDYRSIDTNRKKKKTITEGTLVKVQPSPDLRVRCQDPELGHLQDIAWTGDPIVGVVTKMWGSGYGVREVELFSSGEFFLVTTNNGLSEIEVLEC